MDAINIIIHIRTFAEFVTDKVQSMAEFNKSYAEIAQKFQQDLLFLHSFEALFVEDDGNFIRNENISEHIVVSQGNLSSMGRLFSEYKSIAEEYQESESADEAGSLCQRAKRRVSWAICGKRKTMDVLKQYSAYTQNLHETTTHAVDTSCSRRRVPTRGCEPQAGESTICLHTHAARRVHGSRRKTAD
ncbi:uncharacterized protein APUU_41612S [Aspergillus puulaauensis]|uniref:Uncharacterized protein n=1 Tax=Aspergillus puulaauensis TaxID=1220207 RepID=A0A7R7XQK9_9EURO|nr:uncharacterized protein APUU_41612S [Aspergillus puulaauensis]BCS25168.1 hypothetical protein APUU_41612S [Aspergillus puulaauensis]